MQFYVEISMGYCFDVQLISRPDAGVIPNSAGVIPIRLDVQLISR